MRSHTLRSLARSAARSGDWLAAADHYRRLVRQQGAAMNDRIQLGHALKEAGEQAAALDAYRAAADRHPLDVEPQRQLGLYLRRLGREREAIDMFARAAVVDPGAADIRAEIADHASDDNVLDRHMLHGLAGATPRPLRRPGPVRRLLAALALRRARDHARRGDWQQAEHHYRTLIRHDPERVAAHVQLGHALLQQGADASALASYRRALLLAPCRPDTHLHIGHALKRLGRTDGAFASYLMAWRLQPGMDAAATELRALRSRIDDAWLRAVVDAEPVIEAATERPSPRHLPEPGGLERQYRPHFRFLAGSLALKD